MERQNCWEHRNCGKEKDCPAYPHHGRACFAVTGTMCRGERQPSYEGKISKCRTTCDFYKEVTGATAWEKIGRASNE